MHMSSEARAAVAPPSGFGNPWLQLALSTLCVTVSELFLKRGAMETVHVSEQWAWTGLTTLGSPLVWFGMIFTILSFVTWLYVLKHMPLSVAFPASQVVHVTVPLASWWFLGEAIDVVRWCGIALVLLGLAIVARPAAQLEERL
jgi:undecaprenyl phosphate-alpha-L-ara4N flippase subunit ArnF